MVNELRYRPSAKRWHAYRNGLYECPLHCGDLLAIQIGDGYFPCRLELDADWYVEIGETKLRLHPKTVYRAMLLF